MARRVNLRDVTPSAGAQTLPQRIKFLRATSKPYMTQPQLAFLSGLSIETIKKIENCKNPNRLNTRIDILRRIAYALGCGIYINIKKRPTRNSVECQPLHHEGPPLPKREGKNRGATLALAAKYGSFEWNKYRRKRRPPRQKSISDTTSSEPEKQTAE